LDSIGRVLIVFGLVIVGIGLLLLLAGRVPLLGRLPGDIIIQRDNATIYIPLATMIVLSIVLSIILTVISAILRR
jgi:uncharacterized protein HemY